MYDLVVRLLMEFDRPKKSNVLMAPHTAGRMSQPEQALINACDHAMDVAMDSDKHLIVPRQYH